MSRKTIRDYYDERYYNGPRGLSARRWQVAVQLLAIKTGRVLELGAGTGENAEALKKTGLDVVCADFGVYAAKVCGQKKLDAVVADASHLPFRDSAFDGVCSTSFLEHIPKGVTKLVLNEVVRVVRPKGRLVLHTEPNKFLEFFSILYGILNKNHWRRYSESGGHVNTYTPWRFHKEIFRSGISISRYLIGSYPENSPFSNMLKPLSRTRTLIRLLGNETWIVGTASVSPPTPAY